MNIMMVAESARIFLREGQHDLDRIITTIIGQANKGVDETRAALRELRENEQEPARGLNAIVRLAKVFSEATGVPPPIE